MKTIDISIIKKFIIEESNYTDAVFDEFYYKYIPYALITEGCVEYSFIDSDGDKIYGLITMDNYNKRLRARNINNILCQKNTQKKKSKTK